MCLWHVAYFIDARFDTLSSLLFIFPWYPAGSNVKKFKNGFFATPHTPLFLLLHCFKIHRCLEASCSRIIWYQSHSGFLFDSFWFFFLFSEPSDIVCIFHRGYRISEAVGTQWSSGRVVPHLGTRETRSASLSGMATEIRLRLS